MRITIIKIARLVLSVLKPDFRKTMGWVFISSGLVALSPPFIHSLILNFLGMIDIVLVKGAHRVDTLGALLICIGLLYHLLYIAHKPELKTIEVFFGLLIVFTGAMLVYVTI